MKCINIAIKTSAALFVTVALLFGQFAFAADAPIEVNVDNFVRAEMASQIDRALKGVGDRVNTWGHLRTPVPLDTQNVIRMNRDTLYSGALIDISKGATLTIPKTGNEQVVNILAVPLSVAIGVFKVDDFAILVAFLYRFDHVQMTVAVEVFARIESAISVAVFTGHDRNVAHLEEPTKNVRPILRTYSTLTRLTIFREMQ